MFDRFTEEARRSLFFARAKAGERDGDEITAEDLLEGILLSAPESVLRFVTAERDASQPKESLQSAESVEAWMWRLFDDDGDHRLVATPKMSVALLSGRQHRSSRAIAHRQQTGPTRSLRPVVSARR